MKKYINTHFFTVLLILSVSSLSIYFTMIILKFPLVGIELKNKNNQWIVNKIYKNGWASSQPIQIGDILELVDEKKTGQHSTVSRFNRVEMAKSITIMDKNTKKTFSISYDHLETQFVTNLLLPLLFNFTTLLLSVFLYQRRKHDQSARMLIYFMLSIGISYLSASVSARCDVVGRALNTIVFSGCIILFFNFMVTYLQKFDLQFIKRESLQLLYTLYFVFLFVKAFSLVFYQFNFQTKKIELLFFLFLIIFLFIHLIKFYLKYMSSEWKAILKILAVTLFLAFSPFVCLYAIPTILFDIQFVSAEITAGFLIIIPIAFVYLQLTEKLFDIEFLLDRLRYYSILSVPFTVLTVFLLSLILRIKLFSSLTILIFILLFTCTTAFLYIKEYLDYKIRHHLFSPKNNFETSLYNFFKRAKYKTKVDSLITSIMNEIKDVLFVKEVFYIEVITASKAENWDLKDKMNYPDSLIQDIEKIRWENYRIGSLIEVMGWFGLVIGGDPNNKSIILFGLKRSKTNINIQERIWLETLAYFSSILLENFQLIESLIEKIDEYKEEKEINYPYWFSRLMFSLSEKERSNLSVDLHDSVLQDQLQLLREVEKIKGKVTDQTIQNDLQNLKERLLDNIHLIRETCNELRPPFLNELGIIQSIQNLIEQTKLRCDFILISDLDHSIQRLDQEYELILYRVVQELLNNAMKHSLASKVKLSLRKTSQGLFLTYSDNGIGIDMKQLDDSFKTMGIFGMKERIKSIGGTIEFNSAQGKGTQVFIEIKTGGAKKE